MFHGFPYSDIPYTGVSIVTTTNNNSLLAKDISDEMAARIWEIKDKFFPTLLPPKEAFT
ncbi:M81 family metallopeptidase [Heyndrickxia sporothermodurans]